MVKVKVFDSSAAKASKRQVLEAPATDAGAFYDVVDSRRSVRIYADNPVPEEVVQRAMDAALKAPNSSNLQVWEIHWVRSAEKKAELAKYCWGNLQRQRRRSCWCSLRVQTYGVATTTG